MSTPLIVKATIQAAILSATSNILAQLISCHRAGHAYTLETSALVTFVTWTLISCPPNFLWQTWLEKTYPGYTAPEESGTASSIAKHPAVKSATDTASSIAQLPAVKSATDTAAPALQAIGEKTSAATTALSETEVAKATRRRASESIETVKAKARDLEARSGVKSFNKPPARAQTFSTPDGGIIEKFEDTDTQTQQTPVQSSPKKLNIKNTAIKFSLDQTLGAVLNNAAFIVGISLLKGQPLDAAISALSRDFFPLLFAGQKLWPLVSIISFTLVPLEHRTVFGGLIGVGWGIFLSMVVSNPGGKMS